MGEASFWRGIIAGTIERYLADCDCDEQLLFYAGKHNMKQVIFVVLGIVVSCVIYMLVCIYVLEKFLNIAGCAAMVPGFLVVLPLSLLAGGIVAGFLSRPLLDTKRNLIWIAPGFYLAILMLCVYLPFSIVEAVSSDVKSAVNSLLWLLLSLLYWYLASLAGAWLGYVLRRK